MHLKSDTMSQKIAALAAGEYSALSLAEHSLERAKKLASLNAFVTFDDSLVLKQAEVASQRIASGRPISPIDGIPIAVKDNYLTADYPTTACSDARPIAPENIDATIVANLRAAGAIIFGKTNMHEWAYGATNTTSNIGATKNPYNQEHITGGSSGGSAVAVASGMVGAALGSDTGGSVRIPSSACGIYGFKPTYGRASRHGILPLSWSLDAPGPMARSLADIEVLLPFFMGQDPHDPSTFNAKPFRAIVKTGTPRVLNLYGEGFERSDEVDLVIRQAIEKTELVAEDYELTDLWRYFSGWETILHCEATSYHLQALEKNPEGFSAVTRAHLEAGRRLSALELLEAQKLRASLMRSLYYEMPDWDVLVLPTLPIPAPKHGEDCQEFGGRKVTTQDSMTWFCWFGNMSGLPCLTIPVGVSELGLPIGMMLMGKAGRDEELLAVARIFDQRINGCS
ncbi:MAG: amidase [Proteobacteria bacterium]|nr:amidase [Pseudomonadota bacterium]